MTAAQPLEPTRSNSHVPRVLLPFANSGDQAVIATDLEGRVVFWNAVAERMYGWKWQEALGRQTLQLNVPASARSSASKIMDQLREKKSWSGEFPVRHRDGTQFIAAVTVKPMEDEKGNLIGMIGISRPKDE